MPNHDPRAIANEFIRLNGGRMEQMKLQKLVYIANGWNLAINLEPLVNGQFLAWDGGPVSRTIWNHVRDRGYDFDGELVTEDGPVRARLDEDERQVIDHVWRKYSVFTGRALSEMTHQPGTPWSRAYFSDTGRNTALDQEVTREHFTQLALAGRPAEAND